MGLNANLQSTASQTIAINNNMQGSINVDGRQLAQIVFNNLDKVTKAAYGI